jgi:MoxR-like ATPase
VIPDDIKELAVYVLSHRLKLDQAVALSGETVDITAILKDILDRVIPPR